MNLNLNDPTLYVSIVSSSLLILSEILPFLPTNCNGLLHTLFKISPCCKECFIDKNVENKNKDEIIVERMLYKLLDDIDDLEDHNMTFKDIKTEIKKIIHHIKQDLNRS